MQEENFWVFHANVKANVEMTHAKMQGFEQEEEFYKVKSHSPHFSTS